MRKILFILLLLVLPVVLAEGVDLDTEITASERAQFDEILQPVVKIYNFVKYIATMIAAIFMLYAGISYMTSGADPRKREQAKNIALYVILGLIVIWASPLVVNLLI